jgi:hypothetical protein
MASTGLLAAAETLLDLVGGRAAPAGREWLESTLAGLRTPLDREAFGVAFTVAARRVGRGPLEPTPEEQGRLREAGVSGPIGHWSLDEAARCCLLLRASALAPGPALEALVEETYQRGDTRERAAVLRALALLPAPERFVPLAVEACRTSVQPVFEAVAAENPYPAAYFPDLNFNQMVLKALFTGMALGRVVGLEGRITPELRRMAADYASERRAAGRSVPADIDLLLAEEGSPP